MYLITRDVKEGQSVQKKIKKKVLVGINECITLNQECPLFPENYNELLENISDLEYQLAEPVEPLKVGHVFEVN